MKKPCARRFGRIELMLKDHGRGVLPRFEVIVRKADGNKNDPRQVYAALSTGEAEAMEAWLVKMKEWVQNG